MSETHAHTDGHPPGAEFYLYAPNSSEFHDFECMCLSSATAWSVSLATDSVTVAAAAAVAAATEEDGANLGFSL